MVSTRSTRQSSKQKSEEYEYHDQIDPTISFLYTPHNLSLLFLTIGGLAYYAFSLEGDSRISTLGSFGAMALVILVMGLMQFRDGPFIRPHPAFWRIVLAMGLVYQLLLTFALFQVHA